jgi:RNA polymerase sigma-70 factor (ECF subfamily)
VRSIFEDVDAASQPGELTLSLSSAEQTVAAVSELEINRAQSEVSGLPAALATELWVTARAESCSLTREEFGAALVTIGEKYHYGLPPEIRPTPAQEAAFYRGLHLPELALAQACALGRDAAWQRFFNTYRASLTQAAIAITGSATEGHDLADSLYAELFGLTERGGRRSSPLASYSGRGSLVGWLRTTVAQRYIDHHRRTRRETPLDDQEGVAPAAISAPISAELDRLAQAVSRSFEALSSEGRFLLASYFLDQKTLSQIARLLNVHEATISRRLKRLTREVRKQLLRTLQSGGLSRRAAEEALGADPRDLEVNLRAALQTSQAAAFFDKSVPRTADPASQTDPDREMLNQARQ